jgi:DNA-binding MarR family transcriptional regulator
MPPLPIPRMPTEFSASAPSTCHCVGLRQAARRVSDYYDRCLAPCGLRVGQFSILAAVSRGPLSVNALAQQLDLDRTTAGKNLKPLCRAGLLEIARGTDDRRSRQVALTRSGRAAMRAALPLWRTAQAGFEQALGPAQSRQLRATLDSLSLAGTA